MSEPIQRTVTDRRVERWRAKRSFGPHDLPSAAETARAIAASGVSIGVALPALNEAPTVGAICRSIRFELMERTGLVAELVVMDGGSTDGTESFALDAGARVVAAADVLPTVTPVGGKGDSMWRSLEVLETDIVCWIDADIRNFEPHFVSRLVAPLIADASIDFVKATYRRPLAVGDLMTADGGGRVTELCARPLLRSFFPELAGIRQPLAGEYAGRREVLMKVPFFSGYSVEAGLLIDLLDEVGLDAIAQADLGERIHRNRPLAELAPMANSIARSIIRRATEWGRAAATADELQTSEIERPPMANLIAAEAAV